MRKPFPRQSNRRRCAPNPLLVHHPSNHVLPPDPIGEEPRAGLQNLPSSPNPRLSRFSIRHWDPPFFQFHSRGRLVRDRELGAGRLGGRYGSYFTGRLWARDGTLVPHHGWRCPSEQRGDRVGEQKQHWQASPKTHISGWGLFVEPPRSVLAGRNGAEPAPGWRLTS
jgi:hypothetical protein